ncbi:TetR/AcrR family transcriptional regulator [Kribbella lupini]|uniref:TetR/AcrR family transcriptional regulator n=1 Tax=Kribbella lupini TaxID=291602 RepID=A0ABN2B602_9ACTN
MRLTRKGQATKQRIVRTAAGLIAERGVAGTSIENVRTAAGVSGSQMTHYFRDKRSLVQAVVGLQADAVVHSTELDSFDALREWAKTQVQRQVDNGCAGGCRFGSLASELAESDPATRRALAGGFDRWEVALRDGLQAMRDRGELRPDAEPDRLATSLLGALQGGVLLTQTHRDPRPLEVTLDAMLTHVESYAVRRGQGN